MAKARVLVVDDEPEVLRFVVGVLERAEYEVAPAPGPKQALEIIATGAPFDLVVSDVVMPEMCGPGLASVHPRPNLFWPLFSTLLELC